MRTLLFIALGLFIATSAGAGDGKLSLAIGGSAITREDAPATFTMDFDGLYRLRSDLTLDVGYSSSGEGAQESYGRLGLLYNFYRFNVDDANAFDIGLLAGMGGTVKGFAVENSDLGAFFTLGVDADLPALGDMIFAYEVASGIDWPPTPDGRIWAAKRISF